MSFFVSAKSDGADTSKLRPSDWNAVSNFLNGFGTQFSNAALSLKTTLGPQLILQSGDTAEGNATSPLLVRRGLNGDVMTMITSFGTYITNTAIFINGGVAQLGTVNASGVFSGTSGYSTGTGLIDMLDIYSDVNGPCIGTRVSSVPGYGFQQLDSGSNFVFSIENDGSLQWGASASGATGTQSHAAMDCKLSRDGTDILAVKRSSSNCKLRVYGNSTNYLQLAHDGTNTQIGGTACGNITVGQIQRWTFDSGGGFYTEVTNTYDIGISVSSHAPRTIYAGTSMAAPTFQTTTALVATGGGGGSPTLAASSTGGTGQPTTATQNSWLKATDSTGATVWIPVWK